MSLFKARSRVKSSGVLTYDSGNDIYYFLLDENELIPGYQSITTYAPTESVLVWIRSTNDENWASGLAHWEIDGTTNEYRLYLDFPFNNSPSVLYSNGVTNVWIEVGSIISGAPFFGMLAKVSGYSLSGGSLVGLASYTWDQISHSPTESTSYFMQANGRVHFPPYAGAFRYSVDVLVDSTTVTDGTELSVVFDYVNSETPEIVTFPLTDIQTSCSGVTCNRRFRGVSPVLLANDREYLRMRLYTDDTNVNGLSISVELSVEFFAGDPLQLADDAPPPI